MSAENSPESHPTVSGIWITHRDDPRLDAAVKSFVDQDYRPLEVVVFSNGPPIEPPPSAAAAGVPLLMGAAGENIGVARGRNAAAQLATGNLLLFVDDHVVLRPGSVSKAVETARSSPGVGAVAFRILDPDGGVPRLWYYPHDPSTWSERPFEVPNVVGCGHLLRRESFEQVGRLWKGYFIEGEEIDLSWRLLDAGWTIRYEPGAVVEHPERPQRLRDSLSSNLLMYWRLFPAPLALRQTAFLILLSAARAVRRRELANFAGGIRDALAMAPRAVRDRAPLRPATIEYLRHAHACQSAGKRAQWSLRPLQPPPAFGAQPLGPEE